MALTNNVVYGDSSKYILIRCDDAKYHKMDCEWRKTRRKEQTNERRKAKKKCSHRKWDRGNERTEMCMKEGWLSVKCGKEFLREIVFFFFSHTLLHSTILHRLKCLSAYLPICVWWMVSDRSLFCLISDRIVNIVMYNVFCLLDVDVRKKMMMYYSDHITLSGIQIPILM